MNQKEARDLAEVPRHWRGRVLVFDDLAVSISERELCGDEDLVKLILQFEPVPKSHDQLIRDCARHWLSFDANRRR